MSICEFREEIGKRTECHLCSDKKECWDKYRIEMDCTITKQGTFPCSSFCQLYRASLCILLLNPAPKEECKSLFFQKHKVNKECLECTTSDFEECDVNYTRLRNLELTNEVATTRITQQLDELRNDWDGCFGNFNFETECWDKCEFGNRCIRQAGICFGEECTFFSEDFLDCEKACIFHEECTHLRTLRTQQIEKEKEKKRFFNTSFSLEALREETTNQEQ